MAITRIVVKENYYRDSLQLMKISGEVKGLDGVLEAAVLMATSTNKEILSRLGFIDPQIDKSTDDDMLVAIRASDEESASRAMKAVEEMLIRGTGPSEFERAPDIDSALDMLPDANLALISVPGDHVREIAMRLLDRGVHLHVFSDHVSIEDEVAMKRYAAERGLLVLGPGAGTSIINGKAIAFANVVDKGPVGIVAAAGTGLQETSSLLDLIGIGTAYGLGVGGNDPKEQVGGIMTIESIKVLEGQPDVEVIALVSKPPSPTVQDEILNYVFERTRKKYAVAFIGGKDVRISSVHIDRVKQARTLHSEVLLLAKMLGDDHYERALRELNVDVEGIVERELSRLEKNQRYLRGLYTGGTLAYEAQVMLGDYMDDLYSNAPIRSTRPLVDPFKSERNTIVDLGEEEFTKGRAHPMIDPMVRRLRITDEADDPDVAVLLLDFVLGYGSHDDPVGALIEDIKEARRRAEEGGRYLSVISHIVGTRKDPQSYEGSLEKLRSAGIIHMPTNALAVLVAGAVASRGSLPLQGIYERFLEVGC